MPTPSSKPQLAIYAALAIAVLLIGARFLRESGAGAGSDPGSAASDAFAASSSAAPAAGAGGSAPDGTVAGTTAAGATGRLVVDVKGAVRRPGVYHLADGARALDAVHRAGGLTRRADRLHVNLAARVVDGGEVVVPERTAGGSTPTASSATGSGTDSGAGAGTPLSLDINTATEAELEQLDGVGPATAAKIVAYREQNGGFSSIDDLDNVSGIGDAKLAAIRAQLGQ